MASDATCQNIPARISGAIEAISEQLKKELPGLHGFSAESIKKMRQFYEFWSQFINRSPVATEINRDDFLGISFSHHMEILNKTKDIDKVLFYIHETVMHYPTKTNSRNSYSCY